MTFEDYLRHVDAVLKRLCGMDRNMLPDWCYWDDYEEGKTYVQCAKRAIANARVSL